MSTTPFGTCTESGPTSFGWTARAGNRRVTVGCAAPRTPMRNEPPYEAGVLGRMGRARQCPGRARTDAETATLDHGRAADADVAALGGDDDVAGAEDHRVPSEAVAARDADDRRHPAELGPAPRTRGLLSPRGRRK
jgi:hypothetical protein